ncbi:hypothetical protein HLI18_19835 [Rhizobium laguerreae]|uniref:hypothetical protein n=1 Tax=Rhizobium/Agrobacterium group TaxID=227290 RepID=UPI0014784105|nr:MULTISPECIES: hypothetical protein [Rhizobium/Agrobacterium group]NNG72081.1 hypothetical protein [Rhizobium laguerreae]
MTHGAQVMQDSIVEVTKTVSGLPIETLLGLIALGAFGLAAFAIYAVLSVTGRHK